MEVKNENGIIKYTFNSEEEKVIDWAVKRIIDCYLLLGGACTKGQPRTT